MASNQLSIFEFHTGFEVREKKSSDGETLWETDCIFCGKERHFHFFEDTRYSCKRCGEKGNKYNFLAGVLELHTIQSIAELAAAKALPQRIFHARQIRYNKLNDTYVIPTYKTGKLNNLYKYVPSINRIMGSPTISATLFNWDEEIHDTVWLCEGHWDKLAGDMIIGPSRQVTAIGLPGANMFKESFCGAFNDKELLIIGDNDEAGEKMIESVIEKIKNNPLRPKTIRKVVWPEATPPKYDLRDHYLEHKSKAYEKLMSYATRIEEKGLVKLKVENVVEDFSCNSYDKALDSFQTAYHTTPDMRSALACTMASIYSTRLDGEQFWFRMVAAPGAGKTSVCKAVSASDQVVSLSTFTGLFSGMDDGDDSDAGLIPLIAGRTLIVKDADALLKQADIGRIMSEFRDFYDKTSNVRYRNRRHYSYQDVRSTFILCGTEVLRRTDQSFLGERFLTIEMDVSDKDRNLIKQKVAQRSLAVALGQIENPEAKIQSSMKGWINHLRERELDSTLDEEFQQAVIELCDLTALMRTQVDRGFRGKVESPPVPELPTRLIGQMFIASLSLCAVFGVNKPSHEVYQIVCKLLRDTINPRSNRFKIVECLAEKPGIGALDLADNIQIPEATLREELDDLLMLNYIDRKKVGSSTASGPGRHRYAIYLQPKIAEPMRLIYG